MSDWLKLNSTLWTLSPNSSYSYFAFNVFSSGCVDYSGYNVSSAYGVWPVGYLTKNVTITSGEGTMDSPYQLQLNA